MFVPRSATLFATNRATRRGGVLHSCWLAVLAILLAGSGGAAADLAIENVSAGLRERDFSSAAEDSATETPPPRQVFKIASWSPLTFDVVGDPGTTATPVIVTADPDGRPVSQILPSVTIPAAGRLTVRAGFRSGRINAPIQVRLQGGEQQVWARVTLPVNGPSGLRGIPQSTQLWLGLGPQRTLSAGVRWWKAADEKSLTLWEEQQPALLPLTDDLLAGVDAVFLSEFAGISAESSAALRDWVGRGGRLILSIGRRTEELRRSPLAGWLPALPSGETDVANLQGLSEAVNTPNKLLLGGGRRLPGAQLDSRLGRPLSSSLTETLILRSSYGAGTLTQLCISLDEDILVEWDSQSQGDLLALLTDVEAPWRLSGANGTAGLNTAWNPTGITELGTQLLLAVDDFPEVPRFSHWHIMGWIALFALLVGPLDYLFVHRILRRPEWTWGTLALWTALAAGLVLQQSARLSSSAPAGKQVEIVDVDVGRSVVRSRVWRSAYSVAPRRSNFELQSTGEIPGTASPPRRADLGWAVRPEDGFRGIYRSGGIDESRPGYQLSESRTRLTDFPFAFRSSTALQGFWESPEQPGQLSGQLAVSNLQRTGDNRIAGSFQHRLPGVLTDWFLAFSDFAYEARGGDPLADGLPPEAMFSIDNARSSLLSGRLRGLRQYADKSGDKERAALTRDEYNPSSRVPLDIVRMMTFYSAAGGRDYVKLDNHSLSQLDLSRSIQLNHAVLFGRLRVPVTRISSQPAGPEESREVFVRLLLPVER